MADKYERWNKWAPRYVADLMADFGFTPEQAAAFVGNLAAESGYFNYLQELRPLIPGSRGGYGHAQWTGPRRLAFERWLDRKGFSADSYEGNYSYLFRELKGYEPGLDYRRVVALVKGASSFENAVWRVAKYYESPAKINLDPRIKAAREALDLYNDAHPKPSPCSLLVKEEPIAMAPPAVVVAAPAADTSRPAIPWYKSLVFTGATGGLGAAIFAIVQAYRPDVPFLNQLDTLLPLIVAALASASALIGRVTSTAQPLTTSQTKADEFAAAKEVVATAPAVATQPVSEAWTKLPPEMPAEPVAPSQVPLTHLSIEQFSQEMPEVVEQLMGIVRSVVPMIGVLGQLADVGKALSAEQRQNNKQAGL